MNIEVRENYYCKDCNKIYDNCYELENIYMCPSCFSENIKVLDETKIIAFIRKKRLEKIEKYE